MITLKTISDNSFCTLIAFIFMLSCWLVPSSIWASVEVDGIFYDLNTSAKTAAVVSNPDKYTGAIDIPANFVYNGSTYKVTSIGSCAFLSCSELTSIGMPSSVTTIGSSAFERCTGLTDVAIGSGVTFIDYEAFNNCSNLTTLTLPVSLKTIENETFANCTSLTEIVAKRTTAPTIQPTTFNGVDKATCKVYVPEGCQSAYANATNWKAFSNIEELTIVATGSCGANGDNVTYTIYSDMTMVISGTGAMYEIEFVFDERRINEDYYQSIKKVIIEEGVTSIGSYVFHDWMSLTSVTIPNSVISIGWDAFSDCTSLTSVTIPNGVTTIGQFAFCSCTDLTSVTMGNSVSTIDWYAFYDCTSLTSVTIPSSVTTINGYAFSYCPALTSIVVDSGNTKYDSRNNCNAIIQTSNNTLVAGCKNTVIPNSVTSIGNYAFYGCSGLTSISIPNSVTTIDAWAFYDCHDLTSIIVETGNTIYDSRNNCNAIIETATSTLIIGCKNSVIPNSVTSIGGGAFYMCTSPTSVTIPNNVSSIGGNAFSNCTGLTSVTIENGVTTIGFEAFSCCTGLTSVTIPNSVTTIGNGAFRGCTGLTSIIVDVGNTIYDSRNNCNAIIETATNTLIIGCKNTVIPNSVTGIGSSAFSGCTVLTSVTIPNSVTSIGSSAFSYCTSLTSLTIPNSVTSIGSYAFDDCTGLTSVTIENGVTTINGCAFSGCKSLTSVTIPNSVTSIGGSAFYGCTGLTSITCEGETPVTLPDRYVFYFVDKSACTLYVPFGSKSAYESAAYWNEFQNIVEYEPDTDISALDNAIYVEQTEGRIGGTMDIPVRLKNFYGVRGFQFTMELPEGTSINSWSLSTNRLPTGATLSDKIATQKIEGNKITVACSLNYGDATFTGNDGEIATVNVTFGDDMEVGTYPIYLTVCDVTTASGVDEDLSDIKSTLVLEDYVVGDANGDGKVRIGDATTILNYIVGTTSDNFKEKAADANGDGKIRIGDATTILNIIVNQ